MKFNFTEYNSSIMIESCKIVKKNTNKIKLINHIKIKKTV